MPIDVASLSSQAYARLQTDALGAAVRSALGAGAESVIWAEQLKRYDHDHPMPDRPLAALRMGAVSGQAYDTRILTFTWWLYDELWAADPPHARIDALVPLVEAAYPRTSLPFVEVKTANVGQGTDDEILGLRVRPVQFAIYTRG